MNKLSKLSLTVVALGGAIWLGTIFDLPASNAAAVGTQPGTSEDPVVTKSYVDQQIQKALGGGVTAPPTTTTPTTPTKPTTPSGGDSSNDEVKVVTIKPGEKLMAKAGAEFIVRNGKAVVYSSDSNGVADLTDGKDVTNGQAVGNNHLMSFPRDGRGIMVQDGLKSNLIVMVRGGYTVQ
ncbi:hypothetical protein [Paenibacillus pini]|uniref:Uncharacterized protein n=1 Tax=Paenibacillus pini JCM 16418 TaxID=1236976 RepID=W7Z0M5_9BACL|nr:hypothetical protein [Paenibacillus pini]GAF10531.1 hypothetical protein JCM16418_4741 [Paenibacillus pini JCM 16418]